MATGVKISAWESQRGIIAGVHCHLLWDLFKELLSPSAIKVLGLKHSFISCLNRARLSTKKNLQTMNAGEGVEKKGTPLHCWWEQSLLKLMSIESVMPSTHLILCRPLLLPPSIFPSIRVFSNESVVHIRWPNYWRFCFSINPSKEYSELISFSIDWLNLLAVQGFSRQHYTWT